MEQVIAASNSPTMANTRPAMASAFQPNRTARAVELGAHTYFDEPSGLHPVGQNELTKID
eukprot:scaffold48044_cov15-Prasinocladus_malaysianus.AAC.1